MGRDYDFKKDFVVFILTHGRADRQYTYKTLCRSGYTGRCVFVIDNEDEQAEKYKSIYGEENVYIFDKLAESKRMDEVFRGDRRTIVYARNACFEIAKELGYRYFIELDDDYTRFEWRFDDAGRYLTHTPRIKNLDVVFSLMLDFYMNSQITTLAMGQGGDFIGGGSNYLLSSITMHRKAMNSFICSTDRPFKFKGRINEDVNAYTQLSSIGMLFMTILQCSLKQKQTQTNAGGMTDVYNDSGTFLKSFSSVIVYPSGVKVALLNSRNKRLHHNVSWEHTAPKILSEKLKK